MKNQEMNSRFIVRVGITLLLISALTAALLAFVNSVTKDRIAENERKALTEIVERVFGKVDGINKLDREFKDPVDEVYEIKNKGEKKGYCVRVSPAGFKEDISLVVCADTKGKCLKVEIMSMSDTPGVGTRVKDQNYLDGYIKLDCESAPKYDTISGATISSSAVRRGVVAALSIDVYEFDENIRPDENDKPIDENEEPEREPVDPSTETTANTDTPEESTKKDLFNPRVAGTVIVTRRDTTASETTTEPATTVPADTSGEPAESTTEPQETTVEPQESATSEPAESTAESEPAASAQQ